MLPTTPYHHAFPSNQRKTIFRNRKKLSILQLFPETESKNYNSEFH